MVPGGGQTTGRPIDQVVLGISEITYEKLQAQDPTHSKYSINFSGALEEECLWESEERESQTLQQLEEHQESCKVWTLPRRQQGFILGEEVTRLRSGCRKVTT